MTAITDWDGAYSNRDHVADWASYVERWTKDAAGFRTVMEGAGRLRADLAYGPGERNRLDLFLPEGEAKGLAVFVHGGYWRSFDKSMWSHLAAGALAHGFAVAMPSYTLAPQAQISAITREIAAAVAFAAKEVEGPVFLSGHSAGGHLVSRMVCTDTPLSADVLERLGPVTSISGVHDLRPLLRTSMNDDLKLDIEAARAESPTLLEPIDGVRLTAWVGAAELPEFVRQNDLLAGIWAGLGAGARSVHDEGHNHFSVVDALVEPDSPLTKAWIGA